MLFCYGLYIIECCVCMYDREREGDVRFKIDIPHEKQQAEEQTSQQADHESFPCPSRCYLKDFPVETKVQAL